MAVARRFELTHIDLLFIRFLLAVKKFSYENESAMLLSEETFGFTRQQIARCLTRLGSNRYVVFKNGSYRLDPSYKKIYGSLNFGDVIYPFLSEEFIEAWQYYLAFRKEEFEKPMSSLITQQMSLDQLAKMCDNNEQLAIEVIHVTIQQRWLGLRNGLEEIKRQHDRAGASKSGNSSVFAAAEQFFKGK